MTTWAKVLDARCASCNWPVIDIGVNPPLHVSAEYAKWDWWAYCSNPLCEHHGGEGYFQSLPEWVKEDD